MYIGFSLSCISANSGEVAAVYIDCMATEVRQETGKFLPLYQTLILELENTDAFSAFILVSYEPLEIDSPVLPHCAFESGLS